MDFKWQVKMRFVGGRGSKKSRLGWNIFYTAAGQQKGDNFHSSLLSIVLYTHCDGTNPLLVTHFPPFTKIFYWMSPSINLLCLCDIYGIAGTWWISFVIKHSRWKRSRNLRIAENKIIINQWKSNESSSNGDFQFGMSVS